MFLIYPTWVIPCGIEHQRASASTTASEYTRNPASAHESGQGTRLAFGIRVKCVDSTTGKSPKMILIHSRPNQARSDREAKYTDDVKEIPTHTCEEHTIRSGGSITCSGIDSEAHAASLHPHPGNTQMPDLPPSGEGHSLSCSTTSSNCDLTSSPQ
jgi:hypothetical protein